jgi:hypothetical protein
VRSADGDIWVGEAKSAGNDMGTGRANTDAKTDGGLAGAVGRVTSILAIPYGYTVTLGAAALLAVARLGAPSEVEALCFVVGAVLGFVSLAAIGRPYLAAEIPMRVPWLVVFNLFPIVAALAIIALPAQLLGRNLGYFASSLLATTVYVLCLAVLIRIRDRVCGG